MRGVFNKMKRNVAREAVCVNTVLVVICSAFCALLGIFFTIGGIDLEVYGQIVQPKFYLPPFFMIFFNVVFYALLGAAAGITMSTPYYRKNHINNYGYNKKHTHNLLGTDCHYSHRNNSF